MLASCAMRRAKAEYAKNCPQVEYRYAPIHKFAIILITRALPIRHTNPEKQKTKMLGLRSLLHQRIAAAHTFTGMGQNLQVPRKQERNSADAYNSNSLPIR